MAGCAWICLSYWHPEITGFSWAVSCDGYWKKSHGSGDPEQRAWMLDVRVFPIFLPGERSWETKMWAAKSFRVVASKESENSKRSHISLTLLRTNRFSSHNEWHYPIVLSWWGKGKSRGGWHCWRHLKWKENKGHLKRKNRDARRFTLTASTL